MQTGVISFCDRISHNIKSIDFKTEILQLLEIKFGVKILQRHFDRVDDQSLSNFEKYPYWACLRSHGNPYFMLLTQYEDVNQVLFIDKKIQPGYHHPRMLTTKSRFHDSLFERGGTLLDGEMVKDYKNNKWYFLINDAFGISGQSLERDTFVQRINKIYKMLNTHYCPDEDLDIARIQIKKYTPLNELQSLLDFQKELPYPCRGVYFKTNPLKVRPKMLEFDENKIKPVFRPIKDNPAFCGDRQNNLNSQQNQPRHYSTTNQNQTGNRTANQPQPQQQQQQTQQVHVQQHVQAHVQQKFVPNIQQKPEGTVFNLIKTENADVYQVVDTTTNVSHGIAHVPTMKLSKELRTVFRDLKVMGSRPYECVYVEEFKKYQPIMAQ